MEVCSQSRKFSILSILFGISCNSQTLWVCMQPTCVLHVPLSRARQTYHNVPCERYFFWLWVSGRTLTSSIDEALFTWSVNHMYFCSCSSLTSPACTKAVGHFDHSDRYERRLRLSLSRPHPVLTQKRLYSKMGWFYYVQNHGNLFAILRVPKYVPISSTKNISAQVTDHTIYSTRVFEVNTRPTMMATMNPGTRLTFADYFS